MVEGLVGSVLTALYHDVRFKSGDDVEKPAPLVSLELILEAGADVVKAVANAEMKAAGSWVWLRVARPQVRGSSLGCSLGCKSRV